ncbi:MAG TPA: type II CAAX endopeptidase family protein [Candidatus Acidoferrales bacterium]|nr:type II CAAX endopeptidase family protein [Candidatus Acidoferrales bacterium]
MKGDDAELATPDGWPSASMAGEPPNDDRIAKALRGFGPLGLLAILVIVVVPTPALKSILVLVWAWRSHTPWREIGYVRPRSWVRTLMVGLAFGGAFKLLMKAIVMPLLGTAPINGAYHFLAGNAAALPAMFFAVTIGAGFGEETFFRGYLFERLGKLFGSSAGAKTLIIVLTSILFALAHLREQGLAGAEQALITGLVFGTIFAVRCRIFVVMCAHAAFDLFAVALIYWNLEPTVAHLIFK